LLNIQEYIEVDPQTVEQGTQDPESGVTNPDTFEDAFIYQPYEKVKTLPLGLRIHLAIGISATLLCFFIWKWTAHSINDSAWWWIFPMFAFALSVTVHKYIIVDGATYRESIYKGVYIIIGILNLMLFFTNFLMQSNPHPFPWFIYPLFASMMISLFIYHKQNPDTYSVLKFLAHIYLLFNLLMFITWIFNKGFPWFFYPLLILAYPLLTLYVKKVYKENRHSLFITILAVDISLICFITWVFTDFWLPWFLIVWGVLGVGTFFLWRSGNSSSGNYFQIDPSFKSSQETTMQGGNNQPPTQQQPTPNLYPNI